MKCMFCGSENLTTTNTYAKGETITAYKPTANDNMSVGMEPFELSVKRRRVKCNNCRQYFFTIEHFEKTTGSAKVPQYIISNLTLVKDTTDQMRYNFTEEEKEKINALMREM